MHPPEQGHVPARLGGMSTIATIATVPDTQRMVVLRAPTALAVPTEGAPRRVGRGYYSVPFVYIGREIEVRGCARVVQMLAEGRIVAVRNS